MNDTVLNFWVRWGIFALFGACASKGALGAIAPPLLVPDDGNTYDFYADGQEAYDSNLYRLQPNFGNIATQIAPNATRADHISTVSVGGDGQWYFGRQILRLGAHVDENRFANNVDLNNTSDYANVSLDWEAGPYLTGQAGATFSHSLAGFAETRTFGRDLANTTDYFGAARYQVGPHWALNGRVNGTDVAHASKAVAYNDFHLKSGLFNVEYDTNIHDVLAFEYHYSDGRYPSTYQFDLNGVSFKPSYHEDVKRIVAKYALSDKTALSLSGGYLKRSFTTVSVGAFSGGIWRAEVSYAPTDKTHMLISAWQELHAYLVTESDYFVSRGYSAEPTWDATEKLKFTLLLSYEKQSYIAQGTTVSVLGPLSANVATEQVIVTYSPRRSWIFNALLNHTKRDSNQFTYIFDDNYVTVGVLYKIH